MKNKIPLIFSLNLLLALAFGSCKTPPCPEYEVKVDTIKISNLFLDPLKSYHGFDTLKFLSESGDTITFLGQGENIGYNKLDIYAEDNCSTKRTEILQYIGYTFYPISNYPSEIQFYVSPILRTGSPKYFYIIIKNIIFYTSSLLPPLTDSEYIQNLNINGRTYKNVFKVYRNFDYKDKSFIYYSKDEGIIQIVFSNFETLSKIK